MDSKMTTERTVLITGCSQGGIGAALAHEFQRRGFIVFATARNTKKIPESLTSLPNVTALTLDVTSNDSINAAREAIGTSTQRRLDILVNNSGAAITYPTIDVDLDEVKAMFDVNVFGVLAMCQAFAPLLVKGTDPMIVNVSSIAGESAPPLQAVYGASKAAVTGMSETLRLELEPLGIKVMTLITGIIETNLHANEEAKKLPKDSFYKPIEGWINDNIRGKDHPKGISPEEFARSVVGSAERGSMGKVHVGPISGVVQYMQWWMPTWIWDKIMRSSGPPSLELQNVEERAREARSG